MTEAHADAVTASTKTTAQPSLSSDEIFKHGGGTLTCFGFEVPKGANLKTVLVPAKKAIRSMTSFLERQIDISETRPSGESKLCMNDAGDERAGFGCRAFTITSKTPPSVRKQILEDLKKMQALMRKMRQAH